MTSLKSYNQKQKEGNRCEIKSFFGLNYFFVMYVSLCLFLFFSGDDGQYWLTDLWGTAMFVTRALM